MVVPSKEGLFESFLGKVANKFQGQSRYHRICPAQIFAHLESLGPEGAIDSLRDGVDAQIGSTDVAVQDTSIPNILHPEAETCTNTNGNTNVVINSSTNANISRMTPHSSTEKGNEDEDEDGGEDKDKDEGRDEDVYEGRGEDEEDEKNDHYQEEELEP
ncbi:hypothetical protein PVK06_031406 [Gossypium arboreum]|uniref:Uncharacterized protein n=1 Tax=Gossypium arboreum TaxID=29729 RepID=A0ABR0NQY6_GOSAR|nr:hypothetical protein PVK06_031406 [Gossypium arboreum]